MAIVHTMGNHIITEQMLPGQSLVTKVWVIQGNIQKIYMLIDIMSE